MPECCWPGCVAPVDARPLCDDHPPIPKEIMRKLRGSYSALPDNVNAAAFERAVWELQQWIRRTFDGVEDQRDPGKWERLKRMVSERDAKRKVKP